VTCLCISAAENLVSMATNICFFLFYTVLLELKLVSHLLSNRHEIFMKASLIILLKKSGFLLWISTSDVELCGVRVVCVHCSLQFQSLSPHSSTPKALWWKFHAYWIKDDWLVSIQVRWCKIARCICLLPWIPNFQVLKCINKSEID